MIFNIFKSKPRLLDIIPDGYVDIHSHILPGIDDGAKDVKDSLELILEMKKMGFSKIITTPHTYPGLYNNTNETIKKSYKKLKNQYDENINLTYASEYMLCDSIINKAKNKDLFCIKENYVLVEMSFVSSPHNLYEIIFELKHNNFIPVLAHPERYSFLHNNFKEYHKLRNVGCFFQINLLSATGYYGYNVCEILDKMLDSKIVDFVGSDIHNQRHIRNFKNKIGIKEIELLKVAIERNQRFK